MGVDVDMSAISSSMISISVDSEMCGSEVGATTAAASDVEACVMDDVPMVQHPQRERAMV